MDIRNLCRSGKTSPRRIIRLGNQNNTTIHNDDDVFNSQPSSSSTTKISPYKSRYWKVLFWKNSSNSNSKKKKKRDDHVFEHQDNHNRHRNLSRRSLVPYDKCSYSRNFDHGFAWDDHDDEPDHDDNLSRSFSFRFSDPNTSSIDIILVNLHNKDLNNLVVF